MAAMKNTITKDGQVLQVRCQEISNDTDLSVESLRKYFVCEPAIELRQHWLSSPEEQFRAGYVNVGRKGERLIVFAELHDEDIFNPALKFNDPARNKGDFFEIILKPEGQKAYYEMHVTPTNFRSQFRFPDGNWVAKFRKSNPDENVSSHVKFDDPVFESETLVLSKENVWYVSAVIAIENICEDVDFANLERLKFAFCRSDFSRLCSKPVMSCSNPCRAVNWHNQNEWGTLLWGA